MKKHRTLPLLIVLAVLGSCKESPNSRQLSEVKPVQTANDDGRDEKVDVPANIAGSYLYCQPILEDNSSQLMQKAGCRVLDQKTGVKVDLNRLATKTEWTYQPAVNSNIQATVSVSGPTETYHAIYTFSTTTGQSPNLGDGTGAVVATLSGVQGTKDSVVLKVSIAALILEVIDSRMTDALGALSL